ncbi:hypothetical protein R1flu_028452 [Riccia fluitans]|uniref:Uncharacterized protein n=1 Tax=Riccia fluitans TaxID=41844 RepID=A0ABD1XLQ0_9MARC
MEACWKPEPPAEHIKEEKTKKFVGLDAYVNPGPSNATSTMILQVPLVKAANFSAIVASRPEVEGVLKSFPGMKPGWSIRYDVNVMEEMKSSQEAHDDMLEWFTNHLTV